MSVSIDLDLFLALLSYHLGNADESPAAIRLWIRLLEVYEKHEELNILFDQWQRKYGPVKIVKKRPICISEKSSAD